MGAAAPLEGRGERTVVYSLRMLLTAKALKSTAATKEALSSRPSGPRSGPSAEDEAQAVLTLSPLPLRCTVRCGRPRRRHWRALRPPTLAPQAPAWPCGTRRRL